MRPKAWPKLAWLIGLMLIALAGMAGNASANTKADVLTAVKVGQAAFPKACQPTIQFVKMGKYDFAQAVKGYDFEGRKVCGILINRKTWRSWPWPMLCRVVAHEMGHLAGKGHVYHGEAKNVMYFTFNPDDFTPYWRCGTTPIHAKASN